VKKLLRNHEAQWIYQATSTDKHGKWTSPGKTKLPNNNSGIQATILASGNIAIVYNPTNHTYYQKMKTTLESLEDRSCW